MGKGGPPLGHPPTRCATPIETAAQAQWTPPRTHRAQRPSNPRPRCTPETPTPDPPAATRAPTRRSPTGLGFAPSLRRCSTPHRSANRSDLRAASSSCPRPAPAAHHLDWQSAVDCPKRRAPRQPAHARVPTPPPAPLRTTRPSRPYPARFHLQHPAASPQSRSTRAKFPVPIQQQTRPNAHRPPQPPCHRPIDRRFHRNHRPIALGHPASNVRQGRRSAGRARRFGMAAQIPGKMLRRPLPDRNPRRCPSPAKATTHPRPHAPV
jgi:hypothetical protein